MVSMEPRPADVSAGAEQSVDGILIGVPNGGVLYVNPAGRRLMGGGPDELTLAGRNGQLGATKSCGPPCSSIVVGPVG